MLRKAMAAAAIIAVAIIAGCGGGGGSIPAATSGTTVSGVAATGAPMSGTAYLKDSAGTK